MQQQLINIICVFWYVRMEKSNTKIPEDEKKQLILLMQIRSTHCRR